MNGSMLLTALFCAGALVGGVTMLVARHPMRVALALIGAMLSLAGVYATLGVHVIAVFQVLIYVGAVMVFMVYVIMLLDVRDPSFLQRYGGTLLAGVAVAALVAAALAVAVSRGGASVSLDADATGGAAFLVQPFSARVPPGLLAALRTDLGAAARGGSRGHRGHQGRTEERWIGRNCCS